MDTHYPLSDVVAFLGDQVVEVIGPLERAISHPATLKEARDPHAVTFCKKATDEFLALIQGTGAGVVLCPALDAVRTLPDVAATRVLVKDPRLAFLRVVQRYFEEATAPGIHPTALVDPAARIDPTASIGPYCRVGRCEIGAGSVLHGHNFLANKTRLGRNVVVHPGTVIGADGFGYQRNEDGEFEKFPHVGGVLIEDDVEIGANTCIDRGTIGDTVIRQGAKIDNLVHIAHNADIGRHTAVIANAMVAGSTRIGDFGWIAPSASVINGLTLGDHVTVGLAAVVVKNVPAGTTVMGMPARPAPEYKAMLAGLKGLVEGSR
ncbi:MAG: UDP-3-O-(3-hydroxymyristoyl)glucosamine N-acyltransferase [Cyanobacteria bacterium RYN_339]|nr:UDP-3-O-(3-hydroxymyristoyl)glucosamine N-acyltransferase [Cyanobacteria bacterium RYN_339]